MIYWPSGGRRYGVSSRAAHHNGAELIKGAGETRHRAPEVAAAGEPLFWWPRAHPRANTRPLVVDALEWARPWRPLSPGVTIIYTPGARNPNWAPLWCLFYWRRRSGAPDLHLTGARAQPVRERTRARLIAVLVRPKWAPGAGDPPRAGRPLSGPRARSLACGVPKWRADLDWRRVGGEIMMN